MVVTVVAVHVVVEAVAETVDVVRALHDQNFDVVGETVGDRGVDGIPAFVLQFDHRVAGIVDVIVIVALAALHGVRSLAAVEEVAAAEADQGVVAAVAVDVIGARGAVEGVGFVGAVDVLGHFSLL
jgi:hypothetical protein